VDSLSHMTVSRLLKNAGTLTGLSGSAIAVIRGASPYTTLTFWWVGNIGFTNLTTTPVPGSCQWGVDVNVLKRKVKQSTSTSGRGMLHSIDTETEA
jgi:hypothetical protein